MKYIQITSPKDSDIPYLLSVHRLPEISRFIDINEENYFRYVTETENVFYYKVFDGEKLVATVHCELSETILYLSLIVIPCFQNQGIGTNIVADIKSGVLPVTFEKISVSINDNNFASLHLFKKSGFVKTSVDGSLIDYTYKTTSEV